MIIFLKGGSVILEIMAFNIFFFCYQLLKRLPHLTLEK